MTTPFDQSLTELALAIVVCPTFRGPYAAIGLSPLIHALRRHHALSMEHKGYVETIIRALAPSPSCGLGECVSIIDDHHAGTRQVRAYLGAPARSLADACRTTFRLRAPAPENAIRHYGVAETLAERLGGVVEPREGGFLVAVDVDRADGGVRLWYGQGGTPAGSRTLPG